MPCPCPRPVSPAPQCPQLHLPGWIAGATSCPQGDTRCFELLSHLWHAALAQQSREGMGTSLPRVSAKLAHHHSDSSLFLQIAGGKGCDDDTTFSFLAFLEDNSAPKDKHIHKSCPLQWQLLALAPVVPAPSGKCKYWN